MSVACGVEIFLEMGANGEKGKAPTYANRG